MAFDATRFLLSRSLIEREGVATSDATRLAVLPSIIQMPLAQSVVLASAIGQREAPPPTTSVAPTVPVPDVVDVHVDSAVGQLEQRTLKPRFEFTDLQSQVAWTVEKTDPEPGVQAAPGSPVTVYCRVKTAVPYVIGKHWLAAVDLLSRAGLCFELQSVDGAADGVVSGQSLAPGPSWVGTVVGLTLSADAALAELLAEADAAAPDEPPTEVE